MNDAPSNTRYGHVESGDGENVVGLYEVVQPDGRERLVTYAADRDRGFNANVSYQHAEGSGYVYRYPEDGRVSSSSVTPPTYHDRGDPHGRFHHNSHG